MFSSYILIFTIYNIYNENSSPYPLHLPRTFGGRGRGRE